MTYTYTYICAGFIILHLTLVVTRMAYLHRYGPTSTLFLALFEAFFALPIYYDVLIGRPTYLGYAGLAATLGDDGLHLIYAATVLVSDLALSLGLVLRKPVPVAQPTSTARWTWLLALIAYAPFAYLAASGNTAVLLGYGRVIINPFAYESDFITTFTTLITASFLAVGVVLFSTGGPGKRLGDWRGLLLFAPAALLDIWCLGKRSIIAFTLLVLGMRMLLGADNRSNRKILAIMASVFMLTLAISQVYQSNFRRETQITIVSAYDNFRIDMGRDHDLKLALSREIDPVLPPILERRGQSLLFIAAIFVPRRVWAEKPWPYAVYATSAALAIPQRDLGWGLTTSLVSEFVANFGLAGIPLVLALLIWALRWIERSQDPLVRLFGTLSLCSLLAVQFSALSVWHLVFVAYALARSFSTIGPPHVLQVVTPVAAATR